MPFPSTNDDLSQRSVKSVDLTGEILLVGIWSYFSYLVYSLGLNSEMWDDPENYIVLVR